MRSILLLILFFITFVHTPSAQETPKREFRGAWIQTVYQPQYTEMDSVQMCAYFDAMLDTLQQTGINALLFQIRPEADAFYRSEMEPWSRFLTGEQGRAPENGWDPMAALIEKCHRRNIEFHAWINPYRAQCNTAVALDSSHIYYRHPEWFVEYGRQLLFDPGMPGSKAFICRVVDDIVSRYDIDAIHMDDYFYPYPINGVPFPDTTSYALYGNGRPLDEWRRSNVDTLISQLSRDIKRRKPWVRFGISPFGIYRNNTTSPDGSATCGLQNYDDLYADVLLWARNGWVDYLIPQLYWEIGHKAACYEELVGWWNRNVPDGCHLYIGQDVCRSLDAADANPLRSQLGHKMVLSRYLDHISGICFWSGYQLFDNYKGASDELRRDYFTCPALIPAYTHIDSKAPKAVKKLHTRWHPDGFYLEWKADKTRDVMQQAAYYCVYRFDTAESVDLDNARALVATVRDTRCRLPYRDGASRCVYVVTAVDRMHNEGEPEILKVKL